MKELSTSEVVSSRLLMLALSTDNELLNKVMERGKVNLGKPNDKIYEVELRINGVECDPSATNHRVRREASCG